MVRSGVGGDVTEGPIAPVSKPGGLADTKSRGFESHRLRQLRSSR